ncbi:MAG: 16S rRNA (cytosine(967)-C(5))-methyltransferase RsmB [Pyrinomonadaceae bacterium]
MKISPARTAAFDILFRIETERAYSSVLLPFYEADLSIADRGLCHEITLGTLRNQLYLDKLIDHLAAGKKLDIQIRIALRIAIYQIKFLDRIPDHAAINESVNLVQRAKKTSAKGFVNALLRRYIREPVDLSFADDIERISIKTSHPRWLLEKWIDELGAEEAAKFARSNNELPAVAFTITGENTQDVEALLAKSRRSDYVEGCYIADRYDQKLLNLAETKHIYLQDEASQMTAHAIQMPEGGRFLDVCAAPGGKVTLIATKNHKAGMLIAGDLHWPRVEYLRDNCRQLTGEAVDIVQYDAEKALPFVDGSFDAVLVDAPCSGTGTIRHNPELRYLLAPDDLSELPLKQLSILKNASKLVVSGGILVYSTCSVEIEEGEQVCEQFLSEGTGFESVIPEVDKRFVTEKGFARTWPQRDNMDGFFIAMFRRV